MRGLLERGGKLKKGGGKRRKKEIAARFSDHALEYNSRFY
jgi:hypothetical protein